jgi:hypothetical protein
MAKIYQIEHREFYCVNGVEHLNACSPFVIQTFSSKKKALEFFNKFCEIKLNANLDIQVSNEHFFDTIMCQAEQKYNERGFRNVIILTQHIVSNL